MIELDARHRSDGLSVDHRQAISISRIKNPRLRRFVAALLLVPGLLIFFAFYGWQVLMEVLTDNYVGR